MQVAKHIAMFAGGVTRREAVTSRVDIYNARTRQWSTASLSVPRSGATPFPRASQPTGCTPLNMHSSGWQLPVADPSSLPQLQRTFQLYVDARTHARMRGWVCVFLILLHIMPFC